MSPELDELSARVVELESRLAFQDLTLEELNGVVISQQRQLDRLEEVLGVLSKRLKMLLAGNDEAGGANGR